MPLAQGRRAASPHLLPKKAKNEFVAKMLFHLDRRNIYAMTLTAERAHVAVPMPIILHVCLDGH
jgi:hypothetical protein